MSTYSIEKPKYILLKKTQTEGDVQEYLNLIQFEAGRSSCLTCHKTKRFKNEFDQNPYHIQSDHRIINALYEAGFPTYRKLDKFGRTCLHYKKDYESLEILAPLLQGLIFQTITYIDIDGNSVLHQIYDVKSLNLLLKHDANPLVLNNKGENCISFQDNQESKNFLNEFINKYYKESYEELQHKVDFYRHHRCHFYFFLRNGNYNNKSFTNKYGSYDDINTYEKYVDLLSCHVIKYSIDTSSAGESSSYTTKFKSY